MAEETKGGNPNEQLLKDIREDFAYFRDYWRENYEEAKTDLRFVSGDPWDQDERRDREDNKRPVICPDELDQYLNQAINNLRQNQLAIKVEPAGEQAKDEDAERRSDIIRGIEYQSNAQSAYSNAYSSAINCAFGFFRITTKVVSKDGEVTPRIKIIPNPLSVFLDPNAKELDWSDQKKCFVLDLMRKSDFERKYPKAQSKSFTAQDFASSDASAWFDGKAVVVAEYWRVEGYDPETGDGGKVKQYITNGVEILEEHDWAGQWIPIIPVLGKELYVPKGGDVKRMFYSMIRKARGAQMMMAYIASTEAEVYGMIPKAPFVGAVGQFETDQESWETLNKVPRAYVQYDPVVDTSTGQTALPPPSRPQFTADIQTYEIGKESWRRSIQASMGISPLPTAAQRQNEKSGVALDKIQTQQSVGAYHFTANFQLSLQFAGRQLNDLITKVMDTPREIGVRGQDEAHNILHVVPTGQKPPDGVDPNQTFNPQQGKFDVTISTGPSFQSQREEESQFVDLLIQNLQQIPPPGSPQAKIMALGIRLKNMGPISDEIADFLDPQQQEQIPPQAQAALAHAQQAAQQMGEELQQLRAEKQGKVVEHQGKMEEIAAKFQADMALEDKKLLAQLTIAEVTTQKQNVADREADRTALESQFHDQAHDTAMQQQDHANTLQQQEAAAQQQSQMADQQAANQSAQSAQDAAQQQPAE
jgi:hypothetical protein